MFRRAVRRYGLRVAGGVVGSLRSTGMLLYLKHNGVGGDTSNRTDQISGAQTRSIQLYRVSVCVVCVCTVRVLGALGVQSATSPPVKSFSF